MDGPSRRQSCFACLARHCTFPFYLNVYHASDNSFSGAGAENGTAPCDGSGQPFGLSRRLFFQSNRLCKCQRVAKRKKNEKRGLHCEAKRTAVHAAPTTLCSGPQHPLPLFWLRCPPSRFDRHRLSSLGTNHLDETCKCWEWKYVPHYVAISPMYLSQGLPVVWTRGKISFHSNSQTPRQTTTQTCTVFGPRACCQQRRPAGGLSKEGLFSTSWLDLGRQTAGRRRLQPACPGRHMMVVDSIDVYIWWPLRTRYLLQALPS